jgi:glycosyltransferase involved in cell wall biosynthesis
MVDVPPSGSDQPHPDPGTTAPPSLSVIIPARDAAATIQVQLDALRDQEWGQQWEVIVVDNGSTDTTADLVRAAAAVDPHLRLLDASEKPGAGHARNQGVRAARADAIAFCDADDIVAPGWIAAMGDTLATDKLVVGRLDVDRLNSKSLADSRGRAFTSGPTSFHGYFDFASSCNLGVQRATFDHLGDFDDTYAPGEDLEFGLRAHLDGLTPVYAPTALVHYRYRDTEGFSRARQYGATLPPIAERLRKAGQPAPGRLDGWRNWLWLVRHLPLLASESGRARWLWVAGTRIGTALGGLRSGRLYL